MNRTKFSISVITVCYNAVSTLERTILSVIGQSYPLIDYVIIDGGSTDGTLDIIRRYSSNISYWISGPDNGIYDVMNKGVFNFKGDYLFFLGADDVLTNEFSTLYNFLNGSNILYGNVKLRNTGKIYNGKFSSFKLITNNIPHQAILYPRSVFMKYCYELRYPIFADYVLNLKCWRDKQFLFSYVPHVFAIYDEYGLSSRTIDLNFLRDQFKLFVCNLPWFLAPYIVLRKSITLLRYYLKENM